MPKKRQPSFRDIRYVLSKLAWDDPDARSAMEALSDLEDLAKMAINELEGLNKGPGWVSNQLREALDRDYDKTWSYLIWRPIPGYPNHEASENGRIRRGRKILKGYTTAVTGGREYAFTSLSKEGGRVYIGPLVMKAFFGVPIPEAQLTYLDGDGTNVKLSNLQWTYSRRDLQTTGGRIFSDENIRAIRQTKGIYTLEFVGNRFGVTREMIRRIRARLSYAEVPDTPAVPWDVPNARQWPPIDE